MQSMTPKQRVRVAMSGGQPDRVPVLPAIWWDLAARVCDVEFADILRRQELLATVMPEAGRRLQADGIRLWSRYPARQIEQHGDDWVEIDTETGKVLGRVDHMGYGSLMAANPDPAVDSYERMLRFLSRAPLSHEPQIKTYADLDRLPVPPVERWIQDMAGVRQVVEQTGEDLFIVGGCAGFTMDALKAYRGGEQCLKDLLDDPGFAAAIMAKTTAIYLNRALAYVQAGVDALYLGDAMASASLISPRMFERFCLPLYQKVTAAIKPTGVLTYLHICGNSTPILEMMADSGVDCIEPLDPLGGVDVGDAKRRVGKRVALMGGVNTLTLLDGTPEQVMAEARECIRKGAEGGGYILGAGDMVPRFSPFANVRALARAAVEYGTYL